MKIPRLSAIAAVLAIPLLVLAQLPPTPSKNLDWVKQVPDLPSGSNASYQSKLTQVVTLQAAATIKLEQRVAELEATVASLQQRLDALEKR